MRNFFWSVFSRIRSEYGEIICISSYSARMLENKDQKKLRIWTLFTQWYWNWTGLLNWSLWKSYRFFFPHGTWKDDSALHKKWSFPLRISSVNVIKSRKLRIWSHLLKKPLLENFIFCAVGAMKKPGKIAFNESYMFTRNFIWNESLFTVMLRLNAPFF